MKYSIFLILIGLIMTTISCKEQDKKQLVNKDSIYAWCIVPYDSVNRTPKERISMLKELGIKKYAYDWREKHLSTMATELRLAKENNVEVIAVWMWIDEAQDSVGNLNEAIEKVFDIIEEVNYEGQIWMSFHENYFDDLSDAQSVEKGAEMIDYLSSRAKSLNCKLALYNHGGWFDEPVNQIKIIKALPDSDLGIVYNFHHAHHQIEAFPEIVDTMLPHLWYVNLNGLRQEGPKILTIGEGNHEMQMIQTLKDKGYDGDFGILGHVEDADVEEILRANLNGLLGE